MRPSPELLIFLCQEPSRLLDLLKSAKEKYVVHVREQEFILLMNVGLVREQENTKNLVGNVME